MGAESAQSEFMATFAGQAGAKRLEAHYANPDLVAQRQAVAALLNPRPGERILDVGVGPGLLAAELAAAVGPAGRVSGIDLSQGMVAMSAARCDQSGMRAWTDFGVADATALPHADAVFDAAVSTQVLEYVREVEVAIAQLARVLKPGGRVLIMDTDWDSAVWAGSDHGRTARVMSAFEEHVADPHLPRRLSPLLTAAGLEVRGTAVHPILNTALARETYSYGMLATIRRFVPGHRGVSEAEAEGWAQDLRELGATGGYFFSVNRYLFLAFKG